MHVADVMTRKVKTVPPDATLKEVAAILTELRVSGLPVVESGRVVGVVSEADILLKERGPKPERHRLLGHVLADGDPLAAKLEARTAGEAMTSPAVTITPDRSVARAASLMIERAVNRLPVVDDDGAIVGIVTRADLVRAFVRSDEEIAHEIRDDLILRTLWIAPERIKVEVANGEVRIDGHVDSEAEAALVGTFARQVPGVVSVTSGLTWPQNDL
jgi:CBS domain-containing protein